jgi:hypothetical protein
VSRKLVRHVTADWLAAAQIPGLDKVHEGKLPEIPWANHGAGSYLCQAEVVVARRREVRLSLGNPGQKNPTSTVQLIVWFQSTDPDWLDAQDAMDDITEAILGQLRNGHDLGRADVILAAGEYQAGITQDDQEPVALNGGIMQAVCVITFEVEEVINA